MFAEHPDKIEVDLLRIEPGIDQHEQENHRLPFLHVIGNQLRELPALVFRNARIAVSGQIDQIPLRIDFKMIDQPGFTGSRGNFGQSRTIGQHVDQRRFADVRAADQRKFRQTVRRTLAQLLAADSKNGGRDVHTD